ncbi:AAA family ATPase [Arthrobacter sp. OVS8]|nr:AAA family ATPase [Arthrobacter sp. OVS8]
MVAILLTGMSGVGKSSVLAELARRGFDTVDTDDGGWIRRDGGEPLWHEPLMLRLLSSPRERPLFVQGTVANQGHFYDRFNAMVLLSAPREVILERLRTRTTNDFGKSAGERAKIMRDVAEVEPLLRAGSTHELDTRRPLDETVGALIAIAALK